jgi:hypothetical protein
MVFWKGTEQQPQYLLVRTENWACVRTRRVGTPKQKEEGVVTLMDRMCSVCCGDRCTLRFYVNALRELFAFSGVPHKEASLDTKRHCTKAHLDSVACLSPRSCCTLTVWSVGRRWTLHMSITGCNLSTRPVRCHFLEQGFLMLSPMWNNEGDMWVNSHPPPHDCVSVIRMSPQQWCLRRPVRSREFHTLQVIVNKCFQEGYIYYI